MNIVTGNLLAHDAACTVNLRNENLFPRGLFREPARHGWLSPGHAVLTAGGLSAEQRLRGIRAAAAASGRVCELPVVLQDGSRRL